MSPRIELSDEEREELSRGYVEEFPKYTTQILNLANQNAQSTRSGVVGDMNDLVEDFQEKHPNGTYDDWKEFYFNEENGVDRLDNSSEKLYEMVLNLEEAIQNIDREMAHRYVRDLVLYKTYTQIDQAEVVIKKVASEFEEEFELVSTDGSSPEMYIDGRIGGIPVKVNSMDEATGNPTADKVVEIIYKENKNNQGLEIDASELSLRLGKTIVDGELNERIDTI